VYFRVLTKGKTEILRKSRWHFWANTNLENLFVDYHICLV
jgi:hypothetical protein